MIKLILPANQIPVESTVTKKTGDKKYTLRKELRVFSIDKTEQKIKAENGTVFIVSEKGDANAVSGTEELVWHATNNAALEFLQEKEDDSD
jgi:hypothetical protein